MQECRRKNEWRRATLGVAFFGAFTWAGAAVAQESIGGAKLAQNDVRGETTRGTTPIHVGDQVYQNELVRTGAASLAQIALRDETNVSVGPSSTVKLDRFVYQGSGSTARRVVLDASKGAFRFFSGNSPSAAYEVTTPQATIGVRGTIYDVLIEPGRTRVVVQEGSVHVCSRQTHICRDLAAPGTSVTVGSRTISGVLTPAQTLWHFADLCVNRPDLCNRATFAEANPSPSPSPTQTANNGEVPPGPPPPGPELPLPIIGGAAAAALAGILVGIESGHHQISP